MDRREFVSGALAAAFIGSAADAVQASDRAREAAPFSPDAYDPGVLDPPQFSLFWDFSRARTEWEAVSYVRLFFRPAFQGLHGYFEGRTRAYSGAPPESPVERLMDFLYPETHGVPLFWGQTERAARSISGLSAEEARTLAPRKEEVPGGPDLCRNRLVVGAIRRGLPGRMARQLPFLLYVDQDPGLLARCLSCLDLMRKARGSGGRPPLPDWRIDPHLAAKRFNSWFELVIRRYLRGHWRLPSGTGRLLPLPPPESCRVSFPDFTPRQVDAAIEFAREDCARFPKRLAPPDIEVIPVP